MHHETAVFAPAHHLAFDVKPEMRRLIQRGMERPERHHHTTFRWVVELELSFLSNPAGTSFHGTSLRSGCTPSGQPSGSTSRFR